jgi:tellurite resistance protein
MNQIEQLKNLIIMAAIDGKFSDEEMLLLADHCHELGLSTSDFRKALAEATTQTASLVIPTDHAERMTLLRYLMRMMAADGKLREQEKHLFALACVRMEIDRVEIDELIDQLLSEQKVKSEPKSL